MPSPLLNLLIFAGSVLFVGLLLWPRTGVVARARRQRALARRIGLEDALKHIYKQQRMGQTATLASLGGATEQSPARVVELIERMQDAGFVRLGDGRIVPTVEGERYALQIIRAHRLWERYLADETGVDPLEWHVHAERREHRITPQEADALEERLGYPRFDPHGDPIPTADGVVPPRTAVALSSLAVGERARVTHIEDEPQVVYAQLLALSVYPGMSLRVDEKSHERVVFEADGRSIVLAPLVAENVSVERIQVREAGETTAGESMATLEPGQSARVMRISAACRGLERRRLMDLGIVPGTRVTFERRGLTGGLAAYRVRSTLIALREEQAQMIIVDDITRPDAGVEQHG